MVEKEVPVLYKRKEECCGCTACYAICPKEAISMVEDEEGFEYPKIDENKCVHCNKCLKVCPMNVEVNNESRRRKNSTDCILCYECTKECPVKALH